MSSGNIIERRERAFAAIEGMSPELRQCVHEYGLPIVQACLDVKVKEPRRIHQLVKEIWEGARQPKQRRERLGMLDWILLQAGAEISAATLLRILDANSMAIVSKSPSREMIAASMAELSDHTERVTKSEKHKRRLVAAIKVAAAQLRPQLLKIVPGKDSAA